MIVEFVEFRHKPGMTREQILEDARATVPKWQANADLVRKYYVAGENDMGGAFYVWPSREAAERGHDAGARGSGEHDFVRATVGGPALPGRHGTTGALDVGRA